MQHRRNWVWIALVAILASVGTAYGQGVQTGTLTGTVTDEDGGRIPGVTVTATSPALLGERSTVSGTNGDYVLPSLPPGLYTVTFSLEGMQSVQTSVNVLLGSTARFDATMVVAAAEETITVTGEAPSVLETTTIGANLESEVVDQLPIGRAPAVVADLAPGLTNNTPLGGQVTINGAMAYDNAFLINGVNVQDPVFGQTNNLFIEDTIEETQILTSGISAEYGGFTGGVVNAITKTGGNKFSGSLRADLTKPEWRDETPFEKDRGSEREGDMNKVFSVTFGGPIVRDRLWFFLAGQQADPKATIIARSFQYTGLPYNTTSENPRYEIKLNGAITQNHSLQVSLINNDRTDTNNRQLRPIEAAALACATCDFPNEGKSASYTGIFTNNLYGELRYAEKQFEFVGLGGSGTDIINDSPYYAYGYITGVSGLWNASYFDATDPDGRNNEEWTASLSYFLSSEAAGSHDIKVGFDSFTVNRTGGNSQTPTDYVWVTDPAVDASGDLVRGPDGRLIPVFQNGLSQLWIYRATRGAELDITTDSLFVNDRWNLNKNWSFNLGLRYEQSNSEASGNITSVDSTNLSPRFGASFDVNGDGKFKVDATYARYAGRYNPSLFNKNTPVSNPLGEYYTYVGPDGQGRDFAPGYDLSNYHLDRIDDPSRNVFYADDIQSPTVDEYTVSFGLLLPKGGYAKLTYVNRESGDFIESFTTIDNGCTDIGGTCFDNVLYKNSSKPTRDYQGLQVSASYRIQDNWTVAGNWTHQLKNEGTYEGEAGQSVGPSTGFGDRPEIFPENRLYPSGRFDDYQQDKVRLWTTYNLDLGRAGTLGFGLLGNYDSALTYSYTSTCRTTDIMRARNPGYQQVPSSFTCFFGERGSGEFDDFYSFDLSLNYGIPVWKSLEPWVKFDVRNVLNYDKPVTWNTTVTPNTAGPVDEHGLPTTFNRGPNFGRALREADYITPREYRINVGIRF
ncbi:MAG: TonB-dependent receptor [Thermoanaerobaculia bacterium]|nr:MAG: TonB-dependent receptor [Thermoanaerobaculia bacterium]